jgi:hypothetical protein
MYFTDDVIIILILSGCFVVIMFIYAISKSL